MNKNCIISVNTNATIINESVKNFINKLKFNISVSIDGYSKETFEMIRKHSNRDNVFANTLFFKDYTKHANTFFNVKICALKQNIYEFPDLFNYFNQLEIPIIINEVVYPLNTALWNYRPEKLMKIIEYLKANYPVFKKEKNNFYNHKVWKDLLKLLYTYYNNTLKFEKFLKENHKLTTKVKEKIYKKLEPEFLSKNQLNQFISNLVKFAKTDKELKILYFFFLIAPFERMIGEIEIRDDNELKQIFENIFKYFEWA